MLEYLLLGGGFAFAAVVQPGPLQAFLLARASNDGWRRTLPAAFAPVLSDGPIAALVLLALGQLPATGQRVLRGAGGILLLCLAWGALRGARTPPGHAGSARSSSPRTLMQATVVNLLNPSPYMGWALVMGPAAVAAWHQSTMHAVALVAAFYGVMVAGLVAFIVLASTARLLPPGGQRALALASAGVLAALGLYQFVASVGAGWRDVNLLHPRGQA
jgi:threonine/homoserine/homoserine lactone efflux protein